MLFRPNRLRFLITRCAVLLPSHQQKCLTARFISNDVKSSSSSSSSLLSLPNPPLSFTSKNDERPMPLSAEFVKTITDEFLLDEKRRDEIIIQSRIIKRELLSSQFIWERGGSLDESAKALTKLEDAISHATARLETTPAITREGSLPYLFQEAIKLRAFHHFLLTGTLIKQSELSIKYHDDDYLGGIMSLPHQLARYAVGRAIARDAASVMMARDVTAQIFECLLSFDFRNGPLRRRYDGVKYAVKNLEMILYELSLKEERGSDDDDDDVSALERVNREEIEEIRARLEQRDEMREQIIKRCRDSQKCAKQAIFALHRGDVDGGKGLISRCEDIVTELLPIVEKDPSLRSSGSFTATLEEYAEAKLFVVWLEGDGRLASKEEMTLEIMSKEEYVGGLCDLTGEINRLAVAKGTQRDVVVVKSCLATNLEILMMMRMIAAMTTSAEWNKKIEQIQSSVQKMERMLYELSLIRGSQLLSDDISRDDEKNQDLI